MARARRRGTEIILRQAYEDLCADVEADSAAVSAARLTIQPILAKQAGRRAAARVSRSQALDLGNHGNQSEYAQSLDQQAAEVEVARYRVESAVRSRQITNQRLLEVLREIFGEAN
jgi:hypothetical protein